MVKPEEDAEEVSKDSFLKAFKAIKQFKVNSIFLTWLYKIAYFTAIEHLNIEDQQYYIIQALEYLKPVERNLITLFYLEEFSNRDIQKVTELTQSNIKVSLMRSRKKLYGIMKKMLNGELETILKS